LLSGERLEGAGLLKAVPPEVVEIEAPS